MGKQNISLDYSYVGVVELDGWDGKQPLIVFDGACVLCSFFAKWVIRQDQKQVFLFSTAQSTLGQKLFHHYGLDARDFETNLVIIDGVLFERLHGFFAICKLLGAPTSYFTILDIFPDFFLDWLYERIKRNRFALFGKQDSCLVPDEVMKHRIIK